MLKNPNCPQCRNNKRVINSYKIGLATTKLSVGKEVFVCNACGDLFSGRRTNDPDKQMETIDAIEKMRAEEEAKQTAAADNPEPEVKEVTNG